MAPQHRPRYKGNEMMMSYGASGGLKLDISDIFVNTEVSAPHIAATFLNENEHLTFYYDDHLHLQLFSRGVGKGGGSNGGLPEEV